VLRKGLAATIRLLGRPTDNWFVFACWVLVLTWVILAFMWGRDATASNYNIYRSTAIWVNSTGSLPERGDTLARGVQGVYADFTAMNLLIYRVLFSAESDKVQKALFLSYQFIIYGLGIMFVIKARDRLGLSRLHSRALALIVASPLVAAYTSFFLDDKALMFTLPVVALIVSSRWWRPITTGVTAAWAGIGILTLSLLGRRDVPPVKREMSTTFGIHYFDLRAVAIGLVAFGAVTFAAGSQSVVLLQNRALRESQPPFAFSVWRLFGSYYVPVRLGILALIGVALLIVAYRYVATYSEVFVALTALLLLASTNTVPGRVVAFLPLGVLVFRSSVSRWRYFAGMTVWAMLMFGLALVDKVPSAKAILVQAHSLVDWAQVIFVNTLLVVVVIAVARRLADSRVSGAGQPLAMTREAIQQ
jgi:hypothetical protein